MIAHWKGKEFTNFPFWTSCLSERKSFRNPPSIFCHFFFHVHFISEDGRVATRVSTEKLRMASPLREVQWALLLKSASFAFLSCLWLPLWYLQGFLWVTMLWRCDLFLGAAAELCQFVKGTLWPWFPHTNGAVGLVAIVFSFPVRYVCLFLILDSSGVPVMRCKRNITLAPGKPWTPYIALFSTVPYQHPFG